jgi:hypothetical protein
MEWGFVALVIAVLMAAFGRQVSQVQGQAERAAIQSTLGVLRTALVVEHLRQAAGSVGSGPASVALAQRNPFLLLRTLPINYVGEYSARQITELAPGSWLFDPVCACVGYLPLYPQWVEPTPNGTALWFQVSSPPGPLQITAQSRYEWQGQVLN